MSLEEGLVCAFSVGFSDLAQFVVVADEVFEEAVPVKWLLLEI